MFKPPEVAQTLVPGLVPDVDGTKEPIMAHENQEGRPSRTIYHPTPSPTLIRFKSVAEARSGRETTGPGAAPGEHAL